MVKHDTSDSESEDASSSSSEDAETASKGKPQNVLSEYEKQRLSRIAENKARLEALGLPQMASSFKGLVKNAMKRNNKKGKEKVKDDDDEEYRPDEEEPRSDSSSEEDERDKDEDFEVENASSSRKRKKVKNKGLKMKGKASGKKQCSNSEYIVDDDDEALRQAIALSLQDTAEGSHPSDKHEVNTTKAEKKGNIYIQEDKGRKKNKKSFTSRLQMTEDELIGHFFQLDDGKGTITMRDLQRAATAHDFIWTDKELVDMIRCFDSDGDGKISLDDFRKIVVRCNMIKGS